MNYDMAAFMGHWPFRRLRGGGFPAGFGGGLVSSLDAIFYNDPREGDEPLFRELAATGWHLAVCADPALPWMPGAVAASKAPAIRLYPCIHPFTRRQLFEVLDAAAGKAVLVTARLEDDRLCHLLTQRRVEAAFWLETAKAYPGIPFLLSGFYLEELLALGTVPENVWMDTAGLCHGLDPVGRLAEKFPAERIVFGSMYPLQCAESHILNLPEKLKERILRENPEHFMEMICHGTE